MPKRGKAANVTTENVGRVLAERWKAAEEKASQAGRPTTPPENTWGTEAFEVLRPELEANARRRDESLALSWIPQSLRVRLAKEGRGRR